MENHEQVRLHKVLKIEKCCTEVLPLSIFDLSITIRWSELLTSNLEWSPQKHCIFDIGVYYVWMFFQQKDKFIIFLNFFII